MPKKTYPYIMDNFTKYSDPWMRILAFILDVVFIILIAYNFYRFLFEYLNLDPFLESNPSPGNEWSSYYPEKMDLIYTYFPLLPFFFLVWFLYFLGAESILARNSPAKLLLGMRVCYKMGERPNLWHNLVRNVLKMLFFLIPAVVLSFIDNEPLYYSILLLYFGTMVFALVGWLSGSSAQHWIDKLVGTVVVQRGSK